MVFDIDRWLSFIQDNWLVILIVLVVVVGVINFIRRLVATFIMLILMAIVLGWAFHVYAPEGGIQPPSFTEATALTAVEYLQQVDAEYTIDKKGNYKVEARGVSVSGNIKNSKLRLEVLGQSRYITLDASVRKKLTSLLEAGG